MNQSLGSQSNIGTAGAIGKPSLLQDSGRNADRLLQLHERATRLANQLCGQVPTQIGDTGGNAKGGPPVESNVARNLNTASNWLDRIEEQFNRIENAL